VYRYSKIKAVRKVEDGTELLIKVPDDIESYVLEKRIRDAELRLDDGRTISNEQRKKVYAIIRDIAEYQGEPPELTKELFKYNYCFETGEEYFSLSDCNMTIAREFITFLIDFVLEHNIPMTGLGVDRAEDIGKYLYSCLRFRRCAITGRSGADIHHVEGSRVGMGTNRKKTSHSKRKLIALSREWHNRVHQEGEEEIFEKFKIYGIVLDDDTLREIGLKPDDIS
jgi:hypothetical protein